MKLVYIAGCTHSGTTLLNRVLGAHPDAVSLGSLKKLDSVLGSGTPCACGALSLDACTVWGAVEQELQRQGASLHTLKIQSRDQTRFTQDNLLLFNAIEKATGAHVIIDSSRRSSRLQRLHAIPGLEVIPVHLYKHPLSQGGSWKRKGWKLRQMLFGYWARHLRVTLEVRKNPRTVMLSYERFCQQPDTELQRMFTAFGLAMDPQLLQHWGEAPIHTLGGNHMKFDTRSDIVLDEKWRERLNGMEQAMLNGVCSPLWRHLESRYRASV